MKTHLKLLCGLALVTLYAVPAAEAGSNRAKLHQLGSGNDFGISQTNGRRNTAKAMQFGNGHRGQIVQQGDDNIAGSLQLGNNTTCRTRQRGGEVSFCLGLD